MLPQDRVIDAMTDALYTILIVSAPPLIIGLSVGLIISIFQTVTSIQEQTLAFVPKIMAVFIAIMIFGSFMLTTITELFQRIVRSLPDLVVPM